MSNEHNDDQSSSIAFPTSQPAASKKESDSNPYSTPAADVELEYEADNAPGAAVRRPIGHGARWISEGFDLFKQDAGTWVVICIVYLLINLVAGVIPGGNLVMTIVNPIISGGMMLGCASLASGQGLRVSHLFSGFQSRSGPLAIVGLLYLVAMVLLVGVAAGVGAATVLDFEALSSDPNYLDNMANEPMSLMLFGLLLMAAALPVAMAFWFAPVLVAVGELNPTTAIGFSLRACLKNFLPFFIYGILLAVILVISMIPLGLGLLVTIPLIFTSIYASYRDIFFSGEESAL